MQYNLQEACYCNEHTGLLAFSFSGLLAFSFSVISALIFFFFFFSLLTFGLGCTFPIFLTLTSSNFKGIFQVTTTCQRQVNGACLSHSILGEYTERVKDKLNQNQRATWYGNCNLFSRSLL